LYIFSASWWCFDAVRPWRCYFHFGSINFISLMVDSFFKKKYSILYLQCLSNYSKYYVNITFSIEELILLPRYGNASIQVLSPPCITPWLVCISAIQPSECIIMHLIISASFPGFVIVSSSRTVKFCFK
jgi:hypothetical protein